eukprot:CAMPEP_0172616516 /NCGR_PEP_ID=MMETSP1068-20121228/65090_1 /TAXON_ID=35684 /ORGANISM="Pseudopedinella elastica, Strain CCMP716" /LENGTH=77 /DNA_ID=CAMNT_0013421973 /DNA_START=104 /DNA_END=337 /DNA_ORIENTATION=-
MHLMYYLDAEGKRVYTLKKQTPAGDVAHSAHPARFSPDDQFSNQRIACKKRFNLLPTQQPPGFPYTGIDTTPMEKRK